MDVTDVLEQAGKGSKKGFYGDFKVFNDKMYACWARRSADDEKTGYLARGLYLGYSKDQNGTSSWYTMSGKKFQRPLKDWEQFKIADPVKSGERIQGGPKFIITKDNAFHGVYPKIGIKGKLRFPDISTVPKERIDSPCMRITELLRARFEK